MAQMFGADCCVARVGRISGSVMRRMEALAHSAEDTVANPPYTNFNRRRQ